MDVKRILTSVHMFCFVSLLSVVWEGDQSRLTHSACVDLYVIIIVSPVQKNESKCGIDTHVTDEYMSGICPMGVLIETT